MNFAPACWFASCLIAVLQSFCYMRDRDMSYWFFGWSVWSGLCLLMGLVNL